MVELLIDNPVIKPHCYEKDCVILSCLCHSGASRGKNISAPK